jgi:hypothetical protein
MRELDGNWKCEREEGGEESWGKSVCFVYLFVREVLRILMWNRSVHARTCHDWLCLVFEFRNKLACCDIREGIKVMQA